MKKIIALPLACLLLCSTDAEVFHENSGSYIINFNQCEADLDGHSVEQGCVQINEAAFLKGRKTVDTFYGKVAKLRFD